MQGADKSGSHPLGDGHANPREHHERRGHGGQRAANQDTSANAKRERERGVTNGHDVSQVENTERIVVNRVKGTGPPGDEEAVEADHGHARDTNDSESDRYPT